MQHYRSLDGLRLSNAWLTIGSFDGVHRGHQQVIKQLVTGARDAGVPAVVLTFFPHPAMVLGKRSDPYYITTPEEKAALLGELGVDVVITYPFDLQVAQITAQDFVALLHERLRMSHLIVGQDFALGKGRAGNTILLAELGEQYGYRVQIIPAVKVASERISSSGIREAILAGEVERANIWLGRPYSVPGEVVRGDGRGKQIGIPTANLAIWPERAIPRPGVYACQVRVGEEWLPAVTNIGVRPTFNPDATAPTVETHILNFDRDLYGAQIELAFFAFLREERRFPGIEALVSQIHADINQANTILAKLIETG